MEPILRKGHEALDPARLRQYMDKPDRHPQLQAVMAFFEQGLGADDAPRPARDRVAPRQAAPAARPPGRARRDGARPRRGPGSWPRSSTPAPDFARRNWIYLLRLVPRPAGEPARAPRSPRSRASPLPASPRFLVKEALTYLGQTRHPRVAEALVALLGAWEAELDAGGDRRDRGGGGLRDPRPRGRRARAAGRAEGLARARRPRALPPPRARGDRGSPRRARARRTSPRAPTSWRRSSTRSRRACPAACWAGSWAARTRTCRASWPRLAGTRTPEVRALLEDLRKRYPAQEAGRAAARALEAPPPALRAARRSPATPASSTPGACPRCCTGSPRARRPARSTSCPARAAPPGHDRLRAGPAGERALGPPRGGGGGLPALRARRSPARYAFDAGAARPGPAPFPSSATLVREGVRRARRAPAHERGRPRGPAARGDGHRPRHRRGRGRLRPDRGAVGRRPAPACRPRQIEAELAADAFRIHRPLAQWLEEGALRIAPAARSPAAPASPRLRAAGRRAAARAAGSAPAGESRHMSVMSSRGRALPQCSSTSAMTPSISAPARLVAVRLEPGAEPRLAVLPVPRVLGLGHAVGVEHQPVAGVELQPSSRGTRRRS